jgi:imidazolonepropionase-like amidohydrolase
VGKTLLKGGTVIDVRTGSQDQQDVLIDGNRIEAVGNADDFGSGGDWETIDVSGLTVLPGFSNNHVHLGWSGMGWDGGPEGILKTQALQDSDGVNGLKAVANLRKSVKVGLTSLRDHGMNDSGFDAKTALDSGMIKGPRLSTAGKAIMCTGGHTWWCGREADGVAGMRAAVREQVKRGAGHIKIMASERTPQYSLDELKAAADEAHTLGVLITTHATIPPAIRNVVDAGFDAVEHGGPADDDVLQTMAQRGIMVVPTLSPGILQTERGPERGMPQHVVEARHKRFSTNPPGVALQKMREAGIKFAFGTDAGSPCVEHDEIMGEMQALLKYGVVETPFDVIQMLTINGAELRQETTDLGTVEAGKLADLVVIDGDPMQDVAALGNIQHVFVDGEQLVKDGQMNDWYSW